MNKFTKWGLAAVVAVVLVVVGVITQTKATAAARDENPNSVIQTGLPPCASGARRQSTLCGRCETPARP